MSHLLTDSVGKLTGLARKEKALGALHVLSRALTLTRYGAEGGTRTLTPGKVSDFESDASTNSTTSATHPREGFGELSTPTSNCQELPGYFPGTGANS